MHYYYYFIFIGKGQSALYVIFKIILQNIFTQFEVQALGGNEGGTKSPMLFKTFYVLYTYLCISLSILIKVFERAYHPLRQDSFKSIFTSLLPFQDYRLQSISPWSLRYWKHFPSIYKVDIFTSVRVLHIDLHKFLCTLEYLLQSINGPLSIHESLYLRESSFTYSFLNCTHLRNPCIFKNSSNSQLKLVSIILLP